MFVFFFFFQAEDGIRDKLVTGVQTCALPISSTAISFRIKSQVSHPRKTPKHDTDLLRLLRPGQHRGGGAGGGAPEPLAPRYRPGPASRGPRGGLLVAARPDSGGRREHPLTRAPTAPV